ncbi:MAG: hypothetical protein M9916_12185 [Crocinitomicaceae bacterium]|nr:hypothetical protein [Crocinitomicaceae bacterium]
MKNKSLKSLAFIAVAGSLATSCDLLKDLDYTVTPDPLEMHGDSVRVKVDITIPEKGVKKKVSAEVTPFIASTPLKSLTIQGEKATGNGTVINFKAGGKVTYTDVVPYKSDMEISALSVTGKVFKGVKEKGQLDTVRIADATIVTPFMVNKDFRVIYAKDEFKRVTEEKQFAQVNYEKGKSNVRPTEMKDKDIVELQNWLTAAQNNPKINIKNIEITGYASPEGEEDKNNSLSTDRSNTGKETVISVAKKAKNDKAQTEIFTLKGSGEDYTGFKRELQASSFNEDEKNLILRVLEMYSESTKREEEMRAMGKTFTQLDKNIFPILRRSEINVVYDLTGYSDEELKAISVSNPDSLKLEELLFTATLTSDLNEKLRLYQVAAKNFPGDYRAVNNIGAVYYEQNKLADAKAQFEKANGIKDNAVSKNNLGAIAGVEGDRVKAKQLLSQASGAGNEVGYNKGILAIQDGDYAAAVSNFGSEASFNKALAQLLNGDAAAATKTIDNSDDKESAQGYYLKAIAAKHQGKDSEATSNIGKASSKDASFGEKAINDREFVRPVSIEKMATKSSEKKKK